MLYKSLRQELKKYLAIYKLNFVKQCVILRGEANLSIKIYSLELTHNALHN